MLLFLSKGSLGCLICSVAVGIADGSDTGFEIVGVVVPLPLLGAFAGLGGGVDVNVIRETAVKCFGILPDGGAPVLVNFRDGLPASKPAGAL